MIKVVLVDGGGGVTSLLVLDANSVPLMYHQLQDFYNITGDSNYNSGKDYIRDTSAEAASKKLALYLENVGYRNVTKNYEGEAPTLTMILNDMDISPHMDLGEPIGETLRLPRQMFNAYEPPPIDESPVSKTIPTPIDLPNLGELEEALPTKIEEDLGVPQEVIPPVGV